MATVPALLQALSAWCFLPESPRWLLRAANQPLQGPEGRAQALARAQVSLAQLRGIRPPSATTAAAASATAQLAAATTDEYFFQDYDAGGACGADDGAGAVGRLRVAAELAELAAGVGREEGNSRAPAATSATATTATAATPARKNAEGWAALAEPAIRRLLLVCVGLQAAQQLSGINAVVYFTPQILKAAGVPALFQGLFGLRDANAAALLATTLIYLPKVPALLLAMRLMDAWGRKDLLLAFVPCLAACLATLACVFRVLASTAAAAEAAGAATAAAAAAGGAAGGAAGAAVGAAAMGPLAALAARFTWVPGAVALACLSLYGVFFNLSLGPVPNILTSELFPARCRSAAMATSLGFQFFFNTCVGLLFPVLKSQFGPSSVFGGFAAVSVASWVFAAKLVPETKGRSLEEMAS